MTPEVEKWLAVAIICVTALGITALICGHDGTVLSTVVGLVTGVAGYILGGKGGKSNGTSTNNSSVESNLPKDTKTP